MGEGDRRRLGEGDLRLGDGDGDLAGDGLADGERRLGEAAGDDLLLSDDEELVDRARRGFGEGLGERARRGLGEGERRAGEGELELELLLDDDADLARRGFGEAGALRATGDALRDAERAALRGGGGEGDGVGDFLAARGGGDSLSARAFLAGLGRSSSGDFCRRLAGEGDRPRRCSGSGFCFSGSVLRFLRDLRSSCSLSLEDESPLLLLDVLSRRRRLVLVFFFSFFFSAASSRSRFFLCASRSLSDRS